MSSRVMRFLGNRKYPQHRKPQIISCGWNNNNAVDNLYFYIKFLPKIRCFSSTRNGLKCYHFAIYENVAKEDLSLKNFRTSSCSKCLSGSCHGLWSLQTGLLVAVTKNDPFKFSNLPPILRFLRNSTHPTLASFLPKTPYEWEIQQQFWYTDLSFIDSPNTDN